MVVMITGATGGVDSVLTKDFAAEDCQLAVSSTQQKNLDMLPEVADLGVYLTSARSGHITGSCIRVDGGLDATC